jgi:hypothetical protein
MPYAAPRALPGATTAPAILLVEHDLIEANFVHSLFADILKLDVWLWSEPALEPALKLLSIVHFRLILLDLHLPKTSARKAVRSVRRVAPRTPLVLRMRPEGFNPDLDPRVYQADGIAPKGIATPLVREIRRLLLGGMV